MWRALILAGAWALLASAGEAATLRDCARCPEMVRIAAGNFIMGSPDHEIGHDRTEAPRHRVTIAHAFLLAAHETTFAEWDACVADGGCGDYRPSDMHWGRDNRPILFVSWDDAESYVLWLTRLTGRRYRLPSEAEWEYAARAGTTTPFATGETIGADDANYDARFTGGLGRSGPARGRTLDVGSFAPNSFGLFDMSGNVAEWTEDCVHYDYQGAPRDGSAWLGENCEERMVRGGSFASEPRLIRSAMRFGLYRRERSLYVGFRVAATP
jgi:formylglycine-generating enzyme required for sulfatase activity